jgi:hypothetical protein
VSFIVSLFYSIFQITYTNNDSYVFSLSTYFWTSMFLVSVNLSVLVHMAGVFHVVALSIIRYLSLRQLSNMNSNTVWFTYQVNFTLTTRLFIFGCLEVHKDDCYYLFVCHYNLWTVISAFTRVKSRGSRASLC